MDRTAAPNYVDIGGGKRGYRDRNRVAGIPGTNLTAEDRNAVQEELLAVIEAAGLIPNAALRDQVLTALRALFLPRGATTGNRTRKVFTPGNAYSSVNTLTFTAPAPGYLHIIASINLGSPGQQPTGCAHNIGVNGVEQAADNTTGPMTNHCTTLVAAGAITIVQNFATPPGSLTGFCSTSQELSFIYIPR